MFALHNCLLLHTHLLYFKVNISTLTFYKDEEQRKIASALGIHIGLLKTNIKLV